MATFNTAFGSLPKPQDQVFGNRRQRTPEDEQRQKQPTNALSPEQTQVQQQQRQESRTFAQMQQSGQARPAPPAAPAPAPPMLNQLQGQLAAPAGGETGIPMPAIQQAGGDTAPAPAAPSAPAPSSTGGASSSGTLQSRLEQQLAGYTSGPSAYDDPAYKAYREAQIGNMQAEFGAQRSKLEEELAARGLSASSIAGGRYGDLAGQQARARASMEADLMKEAAARQEARGQFGIQQMGSLAELASKREASAADIDLRAKQLVQEAALQGRQMDITEARDKAANQLGYAELGSRERMAQAEMGSRERISSAELASREGIAGRELTQRQTEFGVTSALDQKKFDADVDYRTKQLLAEDKRLTYEQARDIANRDVEKDRLAEQARSNRAGEASETRRLSEQERANKAQEDANTLDRNLREKLGFSTLDLDRERFNLGKDEFMLRLADILSSKTLSEQEKQRLRDRYMPRQTPSAATGGGTGGGYGNDTGI